MYRLEIANRQDAQTLLDALTSAPLSYQRVAPMIASIFGQLQAQEPQDQVPEVSEDPKQANHHKQASNGAGATLPPIDA